MLTLSLNYRLYKHVHFFGQITVVIIYGSTSYMYKYYTELMIRLVYGLKRITFNESKVILKSLMYHDQLQQNIYIIQCQEMICNVK